MHLWEAALYPKAEHDGYGIFMCYTCDKCRKDKISSFRSDIFSRYDTDEQIDDDY